MPADLSIQNAFLDGINEVFQIMFTDECKMYLMDTDSTVTNIYKESKKKTYKEPVDIVAKIVVGSKHDEDPFMGNAITATITVPTKQLLQNGISFQTEEDLDNLCKSKFHFDGVTYLTDVVSPRTLVAGIYQMYEFKCSVDKKEF